MRKVILIISCCLFLMIGNSQRYFINTPSSLDSNFKSSADYYKNHFLWFTGYWNDNKTVFTTTARKDSTLDSVITIGGEGMHLTVTQDGKVISDSKGVDEWNIKIEDGLKILDKTEKDLYAPKNDAKEWGHHFEEVTIPLIHDMKDEWVHYKIDSKDVLNTDPNKKENNQNQNDLAQGQKKVISELSTWCDKVKNDYDRVVSFYKAHKKDKDADLTYVPPPAYSNKCISCDTSLEKLYDIQDSLYVEKFLKPESDMISTCMGMQKNLQSIGIGNSRVSLDPAIEEKIYQAFHYDKDPTKAGACSYIAQNDLDEMENFLLIRSCRKASKLFHDYSKNVETARPVVRTLLTTIRNANLWGLRTDEDNSLAECAGLFSRVLYYYFDSLLVHEHDWSQLANVPFIYSIERSRELCGAKESDLFPRMYKLLNSFHLNIDMDVKVGKEGKGYQITHITGKTKITPEYDFAGDTCYRWVAIEDAPNADGYPITKISKKIDCDIITNAFVAPYPPVYIGTKKYYVRLNELKMDYCHPGKDTILLSAFIPEPDVSAGLWRFPSSPPQPVGTWQIEHIFQSIEKMKELAASGKAKQQGEMMKQQGLKMAEQLKSIQKEMGSSKRTMNLEQLHKIQELSAKALNLKNNENVAPVLSIDFPLQIQNKTTTLNDKTYDAKEINPIEAPVIIYAYYKVKVTYENK